MNTSFEASGAPATVTITAFTDPYCTWCWGSEPILGKIKTVFGDQVGFNYVMGGLIRNIDEFQDPANGIGGEMWRQQAADHWEDASSRHHMPVDVAVVGDIKGDFKSTHPACIATKMLSEMAGKCLFEEIVSGTGSLFAVLSADAMCDMESGACG